MTAAGQDSLGPGDAAIVAQRLARERATAKLTELAFPAQLAFMADPSRLKSALCTRRAGKTEVAALMLWEAALRDPGSTCLYLALTRETAKTILWRKLKAINLRAKLGVPTRAFNEAELTVKLQNGSWIKLSGADADSQEKAKVLGVDYALVVIDECASFTIDLRDLVETHLQPAMVDRLGTIALIGTPGDFTGPADNPHLFYLVTNDREPGWSPCHRWTAFDNPFVATQWKEQIASIELTKPAFQLTAQFRMHYRGEWAIDPTKRVYKYDPARNDIHALPDAPELAWTHVLSIDLGYEDATAFVVASYRPLDPTLYLALAEKRRELTLHDVAARVHQLRAAFPNARLIVDGAAKQAVQELRLRYGLPLLAAEKRGKADFIRMMNADLITSQVRVLAGACSAPLRAEWAALIWDERKARPTERAACENHCADAALYAWRYARNFVHHAPPPVSPQRDSEAWAEDAWNRVRDGLLEEEQEEQEDSSARFTHAWE